MSSDTGVSPTGLAGAGEALAGLLGDDLNISVTPEPNKSNHRPNPEENEVSPEDAAAMAAALEADGGEATAEHETPDADADGAQDEEAAAQDEDTEADPDEGPTLVTVKIDGKTEQLPIDEVVKGYQRQADYSRKTAELADQRRTHEEAVAKFGDEHKAVSEERGQYAHMLKLLANRIQELEPQEPNWQEEYNRDKQNYLILRDQWNAYQEQKRIVTAEQERVAGVQHGETTQKVQKMLADGRKKLLAYEPKWADEKVRAGELADLRKYAKDNLGYTEDELQNALDPRSVIAAHKAMKHDAIMAKAKSLKASVKGKPRVLEAGPAARQPLPANNLSRARKRQAATGSQSDTAAVFENLLTF